MHTILIVDDSPANLDVLVEFLMDDYNLGIATSGEEALVYLQENKPSLILLDVIMPGLSGYEVCRQVKADPNLAEIPVIFITGLNDIANMTEAFEAGAVDYMTKPVHEKEALARVRTHLSIATMTKELAHRSHALEKTLYQLKNAQVKLIEGEKMAALGALVTGVAHEINTPVGTGITASSHMLDRIESFRDEFSQGIASKRAFHQFLDNMEEGIRMVFKGLQRTAGLVSRFKEVSVDQSPERARDFAIRDLIENTLSSSSVEISKLSPRIDIRCKKDLIIRSGPICLSHVLRNLLLNSLQHGLPNQAGGTITIEAEQRKNLLILYYSDNGRGMSHESLKRIFDPFYTTQRGGSCVGLGMHIAYNLVTQKLKGTIICHSTPGKGVRFQIELPIRLET